MAEPDELHADVRNVNGFGITKREFAVGYAERSGVTLEWLMSVSRVVPCDCGEEGCVGWVIVSMDADACSNCGRYSFHHPVDRCPGYSEEPTPL